jgi:malate dehydrogenase (oxaloacetate-decarboxylating)
MATSTALHDRFGRNVVYALTVTLEAESAPLGALISTLNDAGARVGDVQFVEQASGNIGYVLQVFVTSDAAMETARTAAEKVPGVTVDSCLDAAMESHRGGACEMRSRMPIRSNTDLRIVYTPGVARVCKAIEAEPAKARDFTNIANKVAICTNGTAILGLGDIGPLAGLPVMEGKAAIFWEFVGISAEPVLIDTHDPDEFINVMEKLAVGFGAIQVEDVGAPACFQVTRELDKRLSIPVMHDDQHGTATIVMAGLYSALKKTGKKLPDMTCVISGAGAAGTAIADLLQRAGIADVILLDSVGAIYRGREQRMNPEKLTLAERTNKENFQGTLAEALKGRDLFIGVSQPDIVSKDMVRSMAKDPIVFALANPVSEISVPDAYAAGAAVAADGRMMNNAICYPGIFRGALDSGAEAITVEMCNAAAKAVADIVPDGELLPEMMDPRTHQTVAKATMDAAGPGTPLVSW